MNKVLPEGFVYLNEFDPRIQFDIRYSGFTNIFGRPIKSYNANKPICTYQAAIAIKNAQDEFQKLGYSLVIYDAYRPTIACRDMVNWTNESKDLIEGYYVDFSSRIELFQNNYIADLSSHCRGSTLDMTIIASNQKLKPPTLSYRRIGDKIIPWMNDGTQDMGTSFDYMGIESHTNFPFLDDEQKSARHLLVTTLAKYGLMNHASSWEDDAQEWWHFTLKGEPFPDRYFDFPVE